jgi:hypothetical protein
MATTVKKLILEFKDSIWSKIAAGVFLLFLLDSVHYAYIEQASIQGFFEILAASLIANLSLIVSIFIGYLSGKKVSELSHKNWLGWILGIFLAVTSTAIIDYAASHTPGVGWRYEAICLESPYC